MSILGVHARNKPLEEEVDLSLLARRTAGFSGAALANLLNEAAIVAARANCSTIGSQHMSSALDRITIGPLKKNAQASAWQQRITAAHEAGHALVASLLPDYDQVIKVSITPRINAGGLTVLAPSQDRMDAGLYSRQFLECQMMVGLAGRVAEEVLFGPDEVTTGASNDIQSVSDTARMMVTEFGMGPRLGQMSVLEGVRVSEETQNLIDSEIDTLVKAVYEKTTRLIEDNRTCLTLLAALLQEQETVTAEELETLLRENHINIAALRDPAFDGFGP
jgi:cell division protease FtsH